LPPRAETRAPPSWRGRFADLLVPNQEASVVPPVATTGSIKAPSSDPPHIGPGTQGAAHSYKERREAPVRFRPSGRGRVRDSRRRTCPRARASARSGPHGPGGDRHCLPAVDLRHAPAFAIGIRAFSFSATDGITLRTVHVRLARTLQPGQTAWFPYRRETVQMLRVAQATEAGTLRGTVFCQLRLPPRRRALLALRATPPDRSALPR